jgi:hypothetical protein
VPGKVGSASLTDYDAAGGAVFVWGQKSIFASTNKGAGWKAVRGPVKKPNFAKVDFVSAKVGYALTTDGRVWKTTSGGKKWTELLSTATDGAFDIGFGDANDGFLTIGSWPSGAAQAGYVLRTSDGGASWRPELIEKSVLAQRGLVATGAGTAFALDSAQDLFGTTGGGDQGTPTAVTLRASRTKLAKPGNVKISGRLSPGVTEAPITLFVRSARSPIWRTVGVESVSGSGTFTAALGKVKRTSYVVAQWPGDADHNGDGSPPLKITVRNAK